MMNRTFFGGVILGVCLITNCYGQQETDTGSSVYTDQESREIKTLSAEQISSYLNGSGMGFSKVAELNSYPGPRHVLDLSEKLDLGKGQTRRAENIFRRMKSQAKQLGRRLIEKERQLDALFAAQNASESMVKKLLSEIGTLKADLRFTHVIAHMQIKQILTPAQIKRYDALRGYNGTEKHGELQNHHKHSI